MRNVIESEATLDAQPLVVGGAVASLDPDDAVVVDVIGDLAADAAVRAQRCDLAVDRLQVGVVRRRERTGRAGLHAFAAGDAARCAHRVVEVEHDLRMRAAERVADDVVDLFLAAGAHAARALDAGVEVDRHRRMREIGGRLRPRREARLADAQRVLPVVELGILAVGLLRDVGGEHLDDHLLRVHGARAVARDFHAGGRRTAARRGQHALALDLDHARPAVAVGAIAGLVAEPRDFDAGAIGRLEDRLAGARFDVGPVQAEGNGLLRSDRFDGGVHRFDSSSCGKYLNTQARGLGAAWPSPQIEASAIACARSSSSGLSHAGLSISATAFAVPTRQGVH